MAPEKSCVAETWSLVCSTFGADMLASLTFRSDCVHASDRTMVLRRLFASTTSEVVAVSVPPSGDDRYILSPSLEHDVTVRSSISMANKLFTVFISFLL